jgi:hypothetical protein
MHGLCLGRTVRSAHLVQLIGFSPVKNSRGWPDCPQKRVRPGTALTGNHYLCSYRLAKVASRRCRQEALIASMEACIVLKHDFVCLRIQHQVPIQIKSLVAIVNLIVQVDLIILSVKF